MSGGRPSLSLSRKTPVKTRKNVGSTGKKKVDVNKQWIDTINDPNQYKPSNEDLELKRLARKSNNEILAKVKNST